MVRQPIFRGLTEGVKEMIAYCETCGTKMTRTIKPLKRFDRKTGKRDSEVWYRCPNQRFWRYGHWGFTSTEIYTERDSA